MSTFYNAIDLDKTKRCEECGQDLPPKQTHVYAVKVPMGDNTKRWLYSEPVSCEDAKREYTELTATGHEATYMSLLELKTHQMRFSRQEKKRKRSLKKRRDK